MKYCHPKLGVCGRHRQVTLVGANNRYAVAQKDMADNRKVYGYKIAEYMETAFKKVRLHRVTPVGSMERRYKVMCRDKG